MALLEVKNLSFTYPRQPKDTTEPKPALSDVSLEIRKGEFMVLCGASGCGKSTLLRLLKRELAPEGEKSGEIIFCGKEQSTLSEREAACEIGYVLQNPENQIVTDKVWHELAFGLENMGVPTPVIRRRVAEMACFFGIDDWFRKKTTELSGGQKQLLNLASILSMQPKLLILDEPTSQLDPIAASDFIHTLSKINKELGLTILLTEHRLEEVFPLADRVAVMDQGKLLFVESPRQAGHELKKFDPNHRMLLGLPSAVRIYQGLDAEDVTCPLTVRDGRNFIEENYNNTITRLEREPEKKEEKDRPIAMRMKDICFRYEKEEPDVLDHVALTLYEGEVVSLLGGNGAGKTTLLSVISGTNRPYYGKIEVFGKRLQKYRGKEHTTLISHYLRPDRQTLNLHIGQRTTASFYETFCINIIQFHITGDPGKIFLILCACACTKADGITKIIHCQPRHNSIQIDHTKTFSGSIIHQNIVGLGVIMCYTKRKFSCL